MEYSVVVVVVAGTSSAQAPRKPTDIATAAAKATFFRSFILGLPRLGTLFGSRRPRVWTRCSGDADPSNDTDQPEDEDNHHNASKGNGKIHKSLLCEPSILVL